MIFREAFLQFIKQWEGRRLAAYLCPAGYKTIGYGHLIKPRENIPDLLSPEEAEYLLIQDLALAWAAVGRNITYPLALCHWEALTSLTFNIGAAALQRSTLRRCLNRGDLEAIGNEFKRWIWIGPLKSRGLLRRREAELRWFWRL